ncbi:uncharacterized protein A4U43_C03F2970 [Asparagus officinalis]|uniref:Coatomer alpha subunit C-terminal domain-containing protein n=1 Tax=Asparagus officinalis TaxID=4686 RepID=A0A5P1FBC1_ASPOF|nr:uncharacterized protein A4U43_C03F2970 [Asparagus officinalis]
MRPLSRQLGIKNLTLLKPMSSGLHIGSQTYLNAFPSATDISTALENGWNESDSPNGRGPPAIVFRLSQMEAKLRSAYDYTNKGKFIDALRLFHCILLTIPLIMVDSWSKVDEVEELIEVTREYVLGLKIELSRKETKDNNI